MSNNAIINFQVDEALPCRTIKEDKMNVYWKKDGDGDEMVIMLEGKVNELQYLAFGVSGSATSALMVGGDVFITYPRSGQVVSSDYYLNAKAAVS